MSNWDIGDAPRHSFPTGVETMNDFETLMRRP